MFVIRTGLRLFKIEFHPLTTASENKVTLILNFTRAPRNSERQWKAATVV